MLVYPNINPIAFSLGPLKVHWYGLMYLVGFLSAYLLGCFRAKRYSLPWTKEQISDLIFYMALAVIIGGRVFFMLFYDFHTLISDPLSLFRIWEGGMSFHGGLIAGFLAIYLFSRKQGKSFLDVTDFLAPLIPLGLAAGRMGNFINGELWGRITDMPWGMVFPRVDAFPRHPSQLYEFTLEGILLFIVVWWYASKPRPIGRVSAVFLVGYAMCRIFVEFFREPDVQLGFIAFNWLTMGQLLTIPMLIIGIWVGWMRKR